MIGESDGTDYGNDLPPSIDVVPMYPQDAMNKQETYASDIIVDIYSYIEDSTGKYSEN